MNACSKKTTAIECLAYVAGVFARAVGADRCGERSEERAVRAAEVSRLGNRAEIHRSSIGNRFGNDVFNAAQRAD